MRIIGHIPNKTKASVFSDYLYVQGISNQLEPEKDGWAVWIHSEDELDKAKAHLHGFLANPQDPKYQQQAQKATALKERELKEEEESAKKYFDRERTFSTPLPFGLRPVTGFLILASIVVTTLTSFDKFDIGGRWLHIWGMFSISPTGAPEILSGQLWRLVTPIFFHANIFHSFGLLHIVFNVLWLYSLGNAVEARYGWRFLLVFVLLVAALSNTGQYLLSNPFFGGLSGVVYALLGFIWIRSKFDPNADLALHPQTVSMMLIWYLLCVFQVIPNVANVVHTVGLVAGMAWGYLSSQNT